MNKTHYFEVNFLWNSATHVILSPPVKSGEIEATTPSDFPKSKKEKWTSAHLFIAAISSSLMSTFLLIAENSNFKFISFESHAIGKIEKVNGIFVVTEIVLKPKLTIPSTQNENKAKQAIRISEKACAIVNSLKTKINIEPLITVQ